MSALVVFENKMAAICEQIVLLHPQDGAVAALECYEFRHEWIWKRSEMRGSA